MKIRKRFKLILGQEYDYKLLLRLRTLAFSELFFNKPY